VAKKTKVERLADQVAELVREDVALRDQVDDLERQLETNAATVGELRVLASDVAQARDVQNAVAIRLDGARDALRVAEEEDRKAQLEELYALEKDAFLGLCDALDVFAADYVRPYNALRAKIRQLGRFPDVSRPQTDLHGLDREIVRFQRHQQTRRQLKNYPYN